MYWNPYSGNIYYGTPGEMLGYPQMMGEGMGMDMGMPMQPPMQMAPMPPNGPVQTPVVPMQPSGAPIPGTPLPGGRIVEESYIENILRMNLGKVATIYMTFENNSEWNAKIFKGKLEAAGRDHIIISDPVTGKRYVLLMVNLDYITFDEPLTYIGPELPPGVR